jgi:hypothetical protein
VLRPGGGVPYAGLPQYYARSGGPNWSAWSGVAGLYGTGYAGGERTRVVDRQRSAIAEAQRNAQWDQSAARAAPNLDRWLNDQAQPRDAKDPNAAPPPLNPALLNPTDEAVLNGDVLNELVALVTGLERKGKRAEPGLCAPELMTKVVYAGGPGAVAANQFRTPDLEFPAALTAAGYADLRDGLVKAYAPVAAAAHAGKRVAAADADRLLKEVARMREGADKLVTDGPVDEARAVSAFLTRLEAAVKYVKEPNATGVAGAKWSAVGATVDELVRHLNKHNLRIGAAADGDEAAYYSLHRGLLAYYAGLMQAK